ncbi:MAG: hypothetical protein QGG36_22905 [Pirellulaceae bacterium]|nr:hypothetical protein [Pirellulaceae bacterium]MDP7018667.1 hypothetical protein [Pirellulaceae bacterium]
MKASSRMMRYWSAGAISAVGVGLMLASWGSSGEPPRREERGKRREAAAATTAVSTSTTSVWEREPTDRVATRRTNANHPAVSEIRLVAHEEDGPGAVQGPFVPYDPTLCGVDSRMYAGPGEPSWECRQPIEWRSVFAQGGYVGPARTQHVAVYRFRVGDMLGFFYRITREETSEYRLNVGDELRIEAPVEQVGWSPFSKTG